MKMGRLAGDGQVYLILSFYFVYLFSFLNKSSTSHPIAAVRGRFCCISFGLARCSRRDKNKRVPIIKGAKHSDPHQSIDN